MNREHQILNWLSIGMTQSPGAMSELFFYDREDHLFFSLLFTDFWMLDEDLEVAKDVTTAYTSEVQDALIKKVKKVVQEDEDILTIPRLTSSERLDLVIQFLNLVEDKDESINIERRFKVKEGRKFNKGFDIESSDENIEKWEGFKNEVLFSRAETFLNLNGIDIHKAQVWNIEQDGDISIDLYHNEQEENGRKANVEKKNDTITIQRKWWEFWK